MRISELLAGVPIKNLPVELKNIDISTVISDNRKINGDNIAFFAYKGSSFDSHDAAKALLKDGKVAIVVAEHELEGVPAVIVENGRKAFSLACSNYFGNPEKKLTMIGVTGTNGKTTTTYLLEKIFHAAGKKTVRIGTIGADINGKFEELDNTTPSAFDFYRILAAGVKAGATVGISEVSSHALEQGRVYGTVFDAAVFTNITGDHLDYHKDMESYYQAKRLLFTKEYSKKQVINIDHEYGNRLYNDSEGERLSYGISGGDLHAGNYSVTFEGNEADAEYDGRVIHLKSHLVGNYNLENTLAAVGAALVLGVSDVEIIKGVASLLNVPGRLERHSNNGVTAFVDYAHTDDALANVLSALQKLANGRIITVVGAGGDRDRTKRPRMGKTAQLYSDLVVVTSDNPRTEEPDFIISQILAGMEQNDTVYVEPDREKAIALSVRLAKKGDLILIAGKGHEDYQIIGTKKYPFSDSKLVERYLKEL